MIFSGCDTKEVCECDLRGSWTLRPVFYADSEEMLYGTASYSGDQLKIHHYALHRNGAWMTYNYFRTHEFIGCDSVTHVNHTIGYTYDNWGQPTIAEDSIYVLPNLEVVYSKDCEQMNVGLSVYDRD